MAEFDPRPQPDEPYRTIVVAQPMTPTRAMAITVSVLFVCGLVWLAIQIRSIVLLLVLGILLAAAIEPIVNRLRRRGFSRGQGILAIYALLFVLLIGGLALVAPPLFEQGRELITHIPDYLNRFEEQARASSNGFIRTYGTRMVERAIAFYDSLDENPPIQAVQVGQAVGFLTSFVGSLFTTVSVMIVAYYWMTEKALIKRVALGLFPLDRRDRAHAIWDEIEDKLGGWARGQVLLMLIIGVTSTIAYGILGVPFWFLLGIWAGLTELIPFIGPFLGGGLAFLVALGDSWQKAAIVLVFVVILQNLEGNVIVPRVMRNAVGLTPLSVILAVLIGGTLLGPLGAILAIPVAAAVQVLVSEVLRQREEESDDAEDRPGALARRRREAAGGDGERATMAPARMAGSTPTPGGAARTIDPLADPPA